MGTLPVEGGIGLINQIQHLIHLSQWGLQWIFYLRHNPHHADARDLKQFEAAFAEIGRKAAELKEKRSGHTELTSLTAKAEEIQQQFQHFLRRENERQKDNREQVRTMLKWQPVPARQSVPIGGHVLPPLPYNYDALEPYIDAETMRLHHDKHHKSYVDGLNHAEKKMAEARETGDFELIKHWEREAAFHGAGHYLHTIFWNVMSPKGGGKPTGELAEQITRDFGSFDAFKQHFSQAAEKVEGGGWALLVWSPRSQRLEILTAEKHQNLSQWDVIPLLVLDVWEHAYYLKYKNERSAYIEAWWNVVNWPHVQDRYRQARNLRWHPY
jgi:superoxide dismutase, Fe-Mn family